MKNSMFVVLKDFHIEFFFLLFMFALTVQSTVVVQLIEDKICLNQFGFKLYDCLDEKSNNKTLVIKQASIITGYRTTLSKLPAIVTTLFVGSWINNYPSHLKFIITMPCISSILQICILIGNVIFFKLDPKTVLVVDLLPWIFGTIKNTFMSLQTYVVLTNPPEKRIIKFAAIDVASLIGSIAGQCTGGWILDQKPWFPNQPHNYLGVFIISLIFKTTAVLFFVFKVPTVYKMNEKRIKSNPDHGNHNLPVKTQKSVDEQQSEQFDSPVKEFKKKVFSLDAIQKLFSTLTKPREGGRRGVLVLLMISDVMLTIDYSFIMITSFQFAQRAYGWSNYKYSLYNSILQVIPAILQSFGPRILIQKFGLSVITLGLMSVASHAVEQLITGSWLSTAGYFTASIAGCLYYCYDSAMKSLLCKVVEQDEVGGVFSLLSVLNAIITLATDWILIRIFNENLVYHLGFCNYLLTGLTCISLTIFMWIRLKRPGLAVNDQTTKYNQEREV